VTELNGVEKMDKKTIQTVLFSMSLIVCLTGMSKDAEASAAFSWKVSAAGTHLPVIAQVNADDAPAAASELPTRDPSPEIDDTAENCIYRLWPGFGDPVETFASPFDICRIV
jgi:hypothetical protein